MRYDYDAIVVGARVAGAATARLLAGFGHRVLIVDRVRMPSDTLSTHAVLRTGMLQLSRWGMLEGVMATGAPPVREVTLGFGAERIRFDIQAEHGIDFLAAPRRYLLDGLLQNAAVAAGAEVRTGTRVTGVSRAESGRVNGVEIGSGSQRTRVTARVVVGADGINSRIARSVSAATTASYRPTNAIHYAYFSDVDHDGFWFQFTPGINAGLVPTNDGATCVFVARPRTRFAAFQSDPDAEFVRLLSAAGTDLAERALSGTRVSPFRGTPGLPGVIRQAWGPGWALVGDAGYTKDPISAHGISAALRDSELCARAIDSALQKPESEVVALTHYEAMRNALSGSIFAESRELARYRWDAPEASARMRAVSAGVRAECDAMAALADPNPALETTPHLAG